MFYDSLKAELVSLVNELEEAKSNLQEMEDGVKQMAKERQIGFPARLWCMGADTAAMTEFFIWAMPPVLSNRFWGKA